MKIKNIASAIIFSLGVAATGAHADEVQGGRVTFTGSIIDAACSVNPESQNLEVEMGSIAAAQLDNEGKSTPRPFQITLENCAVSGSDTGGDGEDTRAAAANAVSITFDGIADEKNTKLLGISGAQGAGVAITNAGGQVIELGKESSLYKLTDGKNQIDFNAYLQGNKEEVVPGEFSSIANFTLNYQ